MKTWRFNQMNNKQELNKQIKFREENEKNEKFN